MAMRARPRVTDPEDVIVRVTSTSICGSDTHMYVNEIPGECVMKSGDIMGHECMGIVESVGPAVTDRKVGDRVIVSAVIACGRCSFCKQGRTSLCDTTNPSGQQEATYGHRLAGILGYSHITGGYSGGQAEYVRVPFGDVNLLSVPSSLKDSQVLLLSDVCCTGFHGTELAEVREGDNVIVWGAGPVGLMSAYLSLRLKKAARVIVVDNIKYRLNLAASLGLEPFNFDDCGGNNVAQELMKRMHGGADRTIEAVGYRFPRSWLHKFMRVVKLESDSSEIIRDMVYVTKKGGNMGIIGDYFGDANQFPLGQLMEKSITFRGGQLYCQKYWHHLLDKIADGTIDLRPWITHQAPLKEAVTAYQVFDDKADEMVKCQLVTDFGLTRPENDDVKVQSLPK
jgi:threonine dehydrogenase-like Zn-dependent dehydrogenase